MRGLGRGSSMEVGRPIATSERAVRSAGIARIRLASACCASSPYHAVPPPRSRACAAMSRRSVTRPSSYASLVPGPSSTIAIASGAPASQLMFGRSSLIRLSASRSRTTTKCHGCEFFELPVHRATCSSCMMTSSGTGSAAYWRICRTVRSCSIISRAYGGGPWHHPGVSVDQGELERLASALRLATSALEEALEAAENLGNFDHRFDVPRALGGAQRLIGNAEEAVAAARETR